MQTLATSGPAAPIARAIEPAPVGLSILALDLGTTTGWAIRTAEGVILSGTVSFETCARKALDALWPLCFCS